MRTALNAFSSLHCFLTAYYKYVASFQKKLCVLLKKLEGQNFRWLNVLSFAFMLCDDEILFPWLRISILLLFLLYRKLSVLLSRHRYLLSPV